MSILYKTLIGLIGVVFVGSLFSSNEPSAQTAVATPASENISQVENAQEISQSTSSNEIVKETTSSDLYKVESVVDGDTIKLNIGSTVETVRLIGVDTPETVHPSKPVECFGREASNKTKELLTGKMVKIEKDSTQDERDKYGRLLAYIFLEDDTNINKKLIAEGYAFEYTYNLPYKYQNEFKQAETDAMNNKKGLWADGACAPNTPVATPVSVEKSVPTRSSSKCDSNYSGACVPIASDVDCASGSGNGPAYVSGPVYVVGVDVYGLDRDGDGVACER